ncbi:MAG: hypothetical protein ABG776_00795, partial [Cyanobacteria bacterium J06555_13]
KITPLYAQTRILLSLWALGDVPVSKSKFVPSGKAYASALESLVADGSLNKEKGVRSQVYTLTGQGLSQLSEGLFDDGFGFKTSIGPKTTNAILSWFRKNNDTVRSASAVSAKAHSNGHVSEIGSYETFAKVALQTYDQLNRDYNLDDLVPIYRIRREMGDRISRQNFNEWLLEIQADERIQLMGGDLPNVTPDQLEDSVAIPGGGTRFYAKRL